MDLHNIKSRLHAEPPALPEDLIALESALGKHLPKQYRQLLEFFNGFFLDPVLAMYGTDDIVERNSTFEVNKYAPKYIAIGDDSGSRCVMIPVDESEAGVFMLDVGSMHPDDVERVADSLPEWIEAGCPTDLKTPPEWSPLAEVDVYLESMPEGGLKDLIEIKNVLSIQSSIRDMKDAAENPPRAILVRVPYAKYQKLCRRVDCKTHCLGLRLSDDPSIRLPINDE